VRRLLPDGGAEVDVEQLYAWVERPLPDRRPWVLLDMVTSVDGASAASGRSGGLSTPADREVFHALRTACDAVLVGAGTVRAERYGPPRPDEGQQQRRVAHGLAPRPRLVVVSRRLDLDRGLAMFTRAVEPPVILTCEASDPAVRADLADVAEVLVAGGAGVDLTEGVELLRARGIGIVCCEGGPVLNGALRAAGLVDEVCLTISPLLVGGSSARIVVGAPESDHALALVHALEDGGALFLRYVRG
jgi:riboflavin-specific deaminase-like protein